jgi:hypothetical protein
MSGGPTPDDFRAKVFRDRVHPGDWRVEKLCDDGEIDRGRDFQRGMSGNGPCGMPTANTASSTRSSSSRIDRVRLIQRKSDVWPPAPSAA